MNRLVAALVVVSCFGMIGGPSPVSVAVATEEPIEGPRTWKWLLWTSNCKYPCGDNQNHYNCDCFN